jgi:choline kinase
MGIARFDAETAAQLLAAVVAIVEQQDVTKDYFERAVDQFCKACPLGAVDVTDLPCLEIDFPADLETARTDILPRLAD